MWPAVGSWRPDGAATNRGAIAARSKKPTGGRRQAIDADAVVAEYAAWPPAVGRPEPGRLPGPDARLPHLAGRLRTRRSGPGGARRPGPSGAGLQAARADGQALGAEHGEPGLGGHRQLLPLNRRRPTGGGPGGAGPGRAPGIGEGRPAAVPASGRGLPVGAGPGDRHGVLLHRATSLRAGRPAGRTYRSTGSGEVAERPVAASISSTAGATSASSRTVLSSAAGGTSGASSRARCRSSRWTVASINTMRSVSTRVMPASAAGQGTTRSAWAVRSLSTTRGASTLNRSTNSPRSCWAACVTARSATAWASVLAAPPGALNRRSTSTAVIGSPAGLAGGGGGALSATGKPE